MKWLIKFIQRLDIEILSVAAIFSEDQPSESIEYGSFATGICSENICFMGKRNGQRSNPFKISKG